jgi:hypothetical protein
MTHSASEKAPVAIFHPQMLQDYLTIDEFGREMLTRDRPSARQGALVHRFLSAQSRLAGGACRSKAQSCNA